MSAATEPSPVAPAEAQNRFPRATLRAMLLGARPMFYALQARKESMVELLGADAAAAWLMQAADLAGPWRAEWLPLRSLLDHAREHALAFEMIADARPVQVPVLRSVAGADLPGGSHRSRRFFRAVLADATVYSKSNLVRAQDRALLDFQDLELDRTPCRLDTDSAVMTQAAGRLAMIERDSAAGEVLEEALSLVGLHSYAFGHWIAELLPKLWACMDAPGFDRVTVLLDEQMPAQHFEAVRRCLGAGHPIRVVRPGQRLRVARLWTVSSPVYFPVGPSPLAPAVPGSLAVDPAVYADLLQRVLTRWSSTLPPAPDGRLYLARTDQQHRRLLNRESVEAWHRDHGFALCDFARLGFAEQLAQVRGARCIVGPEGSAFFSTFFAPAGTRIAILSGPSLDLCEGYAQVTEALGQRLCVLQGRQPAERPPGQYFGDYEIDAGLLPTMLEQMGQP